MFLCFWTVLMICNVLILPKMVPILSFSCSGHYVSLSCSSHISSSIVFSLLANVLPSLLSVFFLQMFCFSSPMLKNYDKCSQFLMFCSFCKRKCSAHCSSMFTSCAHILVLINCSVLLYIILIMFIHSCQLKKMTCETRYFSKECSESAIFPNVLRQHCYHATANLSWGPGEQSKWFRLVKLVSYERRKVPLRFFISDHQWQNETGFLVNFSNQKLIL